MSMNPFGLGKKKEKEGKTAKKNTSTYTRRDAQTMYNAVCGIINANQDF